VALAAIGLFRDGLRPGEPEDACEVGDRAELALDLVDGMEIGRMTAAALMFIDCVDPWSIDKRWVEL
jgi:hypothetical protein